MRITQRTPRPTAPPTSSLPARAGRWVWGRDTKPRTWPPGVASTRMLPSGPSPLHWSDTRSSAFKSPPSRSPAVSARPSAAVAVGSVPCRTRASSTSSVVTAARPRTVPSALRVRARRSATAGLVGERDPGDGALGLGSQEPGQRERHQGYSRGPPRPAHHGRRGGPEETQHDTRRDEQQDRRHAHPGVGKERRDEIEREAEEQEAEDALHPLEPRA